MVIGHEYESVLHFWFGEAGPKAWWQKSAEFDRLIARRFGEWHRKAGRGELFRWRCRARGRLAEIIILDQFSRNIYRDTPQAFAFDQMALVLAQEAISSGANERLSANEKAFLYMPYMHSESPAIHSVAVELFSESGLENNRDFELRHKEIIDRFGRYPHRNNILARESTPDELDFLKQPGSRF